MVNLKCHQKCFRILLVRESKIRPAIQTTLLTVGMVARMKQKNFLMS